MVRTNALVVLFAMAGLVETGCGDLFPGPDRSPALPYPYTSANQTPQPNSCNEANGGRGGDGGIDVCACYRESAALPCSQSNSCGFVFGNGYCSNNFSCASDFSFEGYHCYCILSCEGRSCGEDNGCGNKCDGKCPNGLVCGWNTHDTRGCRDPKKCAGHACGDVDEDGYSCDGSCAAGSSCVEIDNVFFQDQKESIIYRCQCVPNCSNKPCNGSDGCGGTCYDACPYTPNPCDDLVGVMDLMITVQSDGTRTGTANSAYGSDIVCAISDAYGKEVDVVIKPGKTDTAIDLSWANPLGTIIYVCFPANEASLCLPAF